MDRAYWEHIYGTHKADEVSWYRPHLETSLRLIENTCLERTASILDVGGGSSTLVDDLLARGYQSISVLDISETALSLAKERLQDRADQIHWIAADITSGSLPKHKYDLWHDRAVFHFLTKAKQRSLYLHQVQEALRPGGHIILATFAFNGPEKCSGLEVLRYSAETLMRELGEDFQLKESVEENHITPLGKPQPFLYCRLQFAPRMR
ncbi:MAG: class I SAM-dependent methyltransferase [Acidobacterium ailaaui]|nr:class I SAM-dependent methyltransferase [Pseudacidobacterium ailaaui]MCL6462969.1 class I SAM-dependent methyltransferase [Pseudacidobacterium ailaaui]MDI3254559.1 class I SAM-dependent methyltransferase [Bacillota bacterium]